MNTINTKYTFLLPAYKSMFLSQALESVKNQTYKNFKCIVSDDCSPEDLKCIFDECVGSDSRFVYRRNELNMGRKSLVSHWNLLVNLCDTEYLIMASDDDIYEPIFLEQIDCLTIKYPDVNLFRGRAKRINKNNELLEKDIFIDEYQSKIEFIYSFCFHKLIQCVAHYVFKTKKLQEENGFIDFPLAWCSDNATAISMSDNGVCHTPSFVFSFRRSNVNISSMENLPYFLEKTRARYLYLIFFEETVKKLTIDPTNPYEKLLYSTINSFLYKNVFIDNIYKGALRSSYKDMMKYFKYLNHLHCYSGLFNKVQFYLTWIRMYKIRKNIQ